MKDVFKDESTVEKKIDFKVEKNRVFARSISRQLNKVEENQVSGGGTHKVVCYDTYQGWGQYDVDCTYE